MALSQKRVCAVCVTYHPDSSLPERLSRVLQQVSHLVIVDNGSSSAALRMLNDIAKDEHVTLIQCHENLGSARGLNIGVQHAVELAYDFALLLDQDTVIKDDLVSVLTRIHEKHFARDRLAIVGAGYRDPLEAPPSASDDELASEAAETVIASGSLLSLPAFEHVGPFRDEFFIDYVDSDYCARARRKGYLAVRAKRSLMDHVIGNPTLHRFLWMKKYSRNYSADRLYYQHRNDTVMLRESGRYRHGSWRLKAFGRAFRRCKRVLLFEDEKGSKLLGIASGLVDGMRGRLGKRD